MSGLTAVLLITIALVRRRLPDLSLHPEVSIIGNRVYLGERSLPRNQWFWLKKWHSYIHQATLLDSSPARLERWRERREADGFALSPQDADGHSSEARIVLGLSASGELRPDLLAAGPHLLIIGPTGSGKSECFKLILYSLLNSHSAKKLQLYLIDFKGGATFAQLSASSSVVGFATDLDQSEQSGSSGGGCWQDLLDQLETRERLFAKVQVASFETYIASDRFNEPLSRLIVAVDELTAAYQSSATAAKALEAVATRGRSLGVHLIAANQTLVGLPRIMLTNFRLRIALGGVDAIELTQLGAKSQATQRVEHDAKRWRSALLIEQGAAEQPFLLPIGCEFALFPKTGD